MHSLDRVNETPHEWKKHWVFFLIEGQYVPSYLKEATNRHAFISWTLTESKSSLVKLQGLETKLRSLRSWLFIYLKSQVLFTKWWKGFDSYICFNLVTVIWTQFFHLLKQYMNINQENTRCIWIYAAQFCIISTISLSEWGGELRLVCSKREILPYYFMGLEYQKLI